MSLLIPNNTIGINFTTQFASAETDLISPPGIPMERIRKRFWRVYQDDVDGHKNYALEST